MSLFPCALLSSAAAGQALSQTFSQRWLLLFKSCSALADLCTMPALQDIKRVADYVSQLRRVGKGLGVFEFDRYLSEGAEEAA